MLGGGTFVTQNKILPGSYINVVSTTKATATLGERGMAAIALPLTAYTAGQVIEITNIEYLQTPDKFLGTGLPTKTVDALDELFCHATKAYIYNSYAGTGAPAILEITLNGSTPTTGLVITGGTTTIAQLGDLTIEDTNTVESVFTKVAIDGVEKSWTTNASDVIPTNAVITLTASSNAKLDSDVKAALEGIGGAADMTLLDGVGTVDEPTVGEICLALEPYEFNCIAAYTNDTEDVKDYMSQIEIWRDQYGKKCQLVVYNQSTADYEGIINVVSTVSDAGADPFALVAWVCGAQAGCAVNASCTNMTYDGKFTIVCNHSQSELEECLQNGQFVFHIVYGDVNVLEDINSLTTTTVDKGDDFKSNQTMRVVDQIANDIAKLFNTKYLGKIPNDNAGRVSLWADIVKHHNQLQDIRAIQEFDSSLVTVQQGDTKKSVVVYDVVNPVNAMAQLYMTVVVQ